MLSEATKTILERSGRHGWVLEPEAKMLLAGAGFDVPDSDWSRSEEDAVTAAKRIGWPVAVKVVSPEVIHKSDAGGVALGVGSEEEMREVYDRMSAIKGADGVLVEEMVPGLEIIVGGKIDEQFGPVILFGMGGVGVEIYKDTAIRMAPVVDDMVETMIGELKAGGLLRGYRGSEGVDLDSLRRLITGFSRLLVELEGEIESADLNPVMCTAERCVIADARIILKKSDN